jgi:hypothetical protein
VQREWPVCACLRGRDYSCYLSVCVCFPSLIGWCVRYDARMVSLLLAPLGWVLTSLPGNRSLAHCLSCFRFRRARTLSLAVCVCRLPRLCLGATLLYMHMHTDTHAQARFQLLNIRVERLQALALHISSFVHLDPHGEVQRRPSMR